MATHIVKSMNLAIIISTHQKLYIPQSAIYNWPSISFSETMNKGVDERNIDWKLKCTSKQDPHSMISIDFYKNQMNWLHMQESISAKFY
jgi:hypothetical protein